MSEHATDRRARRSCADSRRRGSTMVIVVITFVGVLGLALATTAMSMSESSKARRSMDEVRVKYLAEAGFERGMQFLEEAVALGGGSGAPIQSLQELLPPGTTVQPFVGADVMDGDSQVGSYTVSLTATDQTPASITVRIDATGYLPDAPVDLAQGRTVEAWDAISVTVRYELERSDVFDYAYFINNWGWFYGNTIYANGNVRSNGQFDVAGYSPYVGGQPIYDSVAWNGSGASLSGYHDDNEDGLADGNDGGVWSGWDIVKAENLRGNGGQARNQHDFEGTVEMPNLTNLGTYEAKAQLEGSSVKIGNKTVCDGICGDDPNESGNLYLHGTAADPIVLDGPIVAHGDVVISGYVTGQGSIYAGRNVYVPDSVVYVDPPTTPRPADSSQATTEAWLSTNWNKDFLGLFARENVVVGDFTHGTWRYYVSGWMASSLNKSKEDAGEDGIPNTKAGMDGILGTADDDVLEDDGVWTVDTYTQEDKDAGTMPFGAHVGDPIPGTGEDIDGDGVFDDTATLADFDLSRPMTNGNWDGNLPVAGITEYKNIATLYANQIDAVIYTNHSFAWTVLGSDPAKINGALVSRNENIVYGTPSIEINYDNRHGVVGLAEVHDLHAVRTEGGTDRRSRGCLTGGDLDLDDCGDLLLCHGVYLCSRGCGENRGSANAESNQRSVPVRGPADNLRSRE